MHRALGIFSVVVCVAAAAIAVPGSAVPTPSAPLAARSADDFHLSNLGRAAANTSDLPTWVPNGRVHALALVGDTLYLGGDFTHLEQRAGLFTVMRVGTGEQDPVPEVAGGDTFDGPIGRIPLAGRVTVVTPDSEGGWFIGGRFRWVGGIECPRLAHIRGDGTLDQRWCVRPETSGGYGSVVALVRSGDMLYVGGRFDRIGGVTRANLAALDVPTGRVTPWAPKARSGLTAPDVSALTVAPSAVVVAQGDVAAFDPASGHGLWHAEIVYDPQGSGVNTVTSLAAGRDVVYLAGSYDDITHVGGVRRDKLAALDVATGRPTEWRPAVDREGVVSALAVAGTNVYVGGRFSTIGGARRPALAAVDATTGRATPWAPMLASNDSPVSVRAIEVANGSVFALADFADDRSGLAVVDAATGAVLPWASRFRGGVFRGSRALAIADGRVALGDTTGFAEVERRHIAALDARTGQPTPWNPGVGTGDILDDVYALSAVGTTLYVGGSFSAVAGRPRFGVAAFDTSSGALLPWAPRFARSGDQPVIRGLTSARGNLYVAGEFTAVNGRPRTAAAAFSLRTGGLRSWSPRVGGFVSEVAEIEVLGSTAYLVGGFNRVGGMPRFGVAAVEATTGRVRRGWVADWPHRRYPYSSTIAAGRLYVSGCGPRPLVALSPVTGRRARIPQVPVAPGDCIYRIESGGGELLVAGTSENLAGAPLNGAAILDSMTLAGKPWDPELDGFAEAVLATDTAVYVGGFFSTVGRLERPYFASFGR